MQKKIKMKKIFEVIALYFFIFLNKTAIRAANPNCGLIRSFQSPGKFSDAFAALSNGNIAVKTSGGRIGIDIWDPERASLVLSIGTYLSLSFLALPDGNLVDGAAGKFNIYNTIDGSLLSTIVVESVFLPRVLASFEDGYFAAGGDTFFGIEIQIWNINNKTLVNKIKTGYSKYIGSLAYIGSGLLASTDGYQNSIEIWNVGNSQLERTLNGHASGVTFLLKLKNSWLVSASYDKTIKIWDANSGTLLNTLTGHTRSILALAELPDIGLLASGGDDGIRVWNLSDGKMLAFFPAIQEKLVVALPNGSLATGNFLSEFRIWDVKGCV